MNESEKKPVDRRDFLKIAATGAAAIATTANVAMAQRREPAATAKPAAEASGDVDQPLSVVRAGSDFMVDVIKSLGFEYVSMNPGSSYRSLHESTINYGGNHNPEILTCLHEEAAVAAHDEVGSLSEDPAPATGAPVVVGNGAEALEDLVVEVNLPTASGGMEL